MDDWLNTGGYAVASAFALEGSIIAASDPHRRGKAIALFFLAALFALDSFAWYVAAQALNESSASYPWQLRTIDLLCVLGALVASIQLKECELRDGDRTLDSRAVFGISALLVYCLGVSLYWCVFWLAIGAGHGYWPVLAKAWQWQGSLRALAIETVVLYVSIAVVALGLLWTRSRILAAGSGGVLRRVRDLLAPWLWLGDRSSWSGLACWLALPVALYLGAGPVPMILIVEMGWSAGAVTLLVLTAVLCAAGGTLSGAFSTLRMARNRAPSPGLDARRAFRVVYELWLG